MHHGKQIRRNRRIALIACAVLAATGLLRPPGFADENTPQRFKIGTCDWSIKLPLSVESFEFAQRNGLQGIQYSFDAKAKGLDLRIPVNRDIIRETVK